MFVVDKWKLAYNTLFAKEMVRETLHSPSVLRMATDGKADGCDTSNGSIVPEGLAEELEEMLKKHPAVAGNLPGGRFVAIRLPGEVEE